MLTRLKSWASRSWRRWLRDLLIFMTLLYAVERWQSRHLSQGLLPDFLRTQSLPTVEGPTRSLWNPEKYTVLYVFAPWCGVCRGSAGNINRLPADRFHIIAIALSWEKPTEVREFVSSTGLRVPVLLGQEREESALGVRSYPSYIIIDRDGRVVKAWSGYTTTLGLFWKSYWTLLWS